MKKRSLSRQSSNSYPTPKGLRLLPYQADAISFALVRDNCLIADEMGLGKTVEAIGVSNTIPRARHVLVVCPASLKTNWKREFQRWDVKQLSIEICNGSFPQTDVVIINYEQLGQYDSEIHRKTWDLLIVDEAHKLKNEKAQRTINLLGARRWNEGRRIWEIESEPVAALRKIFLTGTPILNRPAELWTLVHTLDPNGLGKYKSTFEKRYCDAHEGYWGWDKSGASNLDELNRRMQDFMIRRLKKDVLKELPSKRRQVIVLDTPTKLRKIIEQEKSLFEKAQVRGMKVAFTEISKIRKEVAIAKAPFVIEHILDLMESENKIVVMAHHHEVINRLASEFGSEAVVVDGRTPVRKRQSAVDRFQKDPDCKLFICSIQVGGTGFTLTASSTVIFAELDWVPGVMTQAEDRLHRIGQKDSVLVQHIVLDGSLDAHLIEKIVHKQRIVTSALNAPRQRTV
jgi:SWI/SNF-related matrix-associated actin-dependent regulator 1 of chromatin subfamily A